MPRHLVCLTFDFDALSSWIYRGDDDADYDLARRFRGGRRGPRPRAHRLARDPGDLVHPRPHDRDLPGELHAIHAAGHEIGHHGYLHGPGELGREEEETE